MSDSAVVDKIIVDIQTRSIHLVSDEGEFKTIDCSDNYEAFLTLMELCKDQGEEYMVYCDPTDYFAADLVEQD